jgi:hypothetical protein
MVTDNAECRISYDKTVPLRDRVGNLIGEALVTMRHGNIIISAEIKPNSTLGKELMRREGPMVLDFNNYVKENTELERAYPEEPSTS